MTVRLAKMCFTGTQTLCRNQFHASKPTFKSRKLCQSTTLENDATLYVHWPFCKRICTFCSFNKFANNNVDHQRMRKCLVTETQTLLQLAGVNSISSVYFGGGTPSLAEPWTISSVLNSISRICHFPCDAEVTLEANPTSVETDSLRHFHSAGINRLSLGVQTFNPRGLLLLGRDNTVEDSLQALQTAKSIFPGKVSIDLMFGRPQQTLDQWHKELVEALSVCDDHVSLYQLTLERGTPLYHDVKGGKLSLPVSDVLAEMYQLAVDTLPAYGFYRYEVANFARPGAESRHNLSYWNGTQYIGVGPGAHSRFTTCEEGNQRRQARVQTLEPNSWMKEVESMGHATRQQVPQTDFQILEEIVMLSLRTANGLTKKRWQTFSPFPKSLSLYDAFKDNLDIQDLVKSGLLILSEKCIRTTDKGMSVVDSIVPTLLVHLERKMSGNDFNKNKSILVPELSLTRPPLPLTLRRR
ncbi:radical S-adenosyl methionine domain-containing protein 1, mitochondrial-like isoform X1 [Montipora foliosa]|uniref:radical S-adenosyl methionine domain-containing protein 1, mitochondrial-like isoform X1 n=2 Tax=Montipora TaxID=46703 RepID=UPI0035F11ABF